MGRMRRLKSKKKRLKKKHPDGFIFTGPGFKTSAIEFLQPVGTYEPQCAVVAFDKDSFTIKY